MEEIILEEISEAVGSRVSTRYEALLFLLREIADVVDDIPNMLNCEMTGAAQRKSEESAERIRIITKILQEYAI
jgi:hypothetical protein